MNFACTRRLRTKDYLGGKLIAERFCGRSVDVGFEGLVGWHSKLYQRQNGLRRLTALSMKVRHDILGCPYG